MPRYYDEDYFQQGIGKVRHIISTLTLKAPFVAFYKTALEDEPYRKPWNALKPVEEDQEMFVTLPALRMSPCPGPALEPDEVTQGLFVEHFAHDNQLLIDPPLLKHPSTPNAVISGSPVALPIVLHPVCHLGRETFGEFIKDHEGFTQRNSTVCSVKSLQLDHPICYYLPQPSSVDLNATPDSLHHYQSKHCQEAPPSDPYRKQGTDQRLEQLIIVKMPNPASLQALLVSHTPLPQGLTNYTQIKSKHCEPIITLDQYLIDKPKIDIEIPNKVKELNKLQSEGIVSAELADCLMWNPFYSIAANVEVTTTTVSKPFVCEGGEVKEVRMRGEQFSWTRNELSSVNKPASPPINSTSTEEITPRSVTCKVPTPSIVTAKKVKLNQALQILEPGRASNSVEAFMALRKKVTLPQERVGAILPVTKPKARMVNEIEIPADTPTTQIVQRITLYCLPYIEKLVHKKILAESNSFIQLDVSNIEFFLKEHHADAEACNVLKLLIPLKQAITTALQVSTELATISLNNILSMDARFEVCKRDVNLIQSQVTVSGHSTAKLTQLCKIVEEAEGVVLVLVAGQMVVKNVVLELLVKIQSFEVGQHMGVSGCKAFVIHRNEIDVSFPWSKFSSVVEFNEPAPCLGLTLSQYELEHFILTTTIAHMLPQGTLSGLKVIAFSSLDARILQKLEAVHGFELFQRQSHGLFSTESLIVDERSCIVIVTSLNEIKLVKSLSSLFIKLSAKYTVCSVIVDISTCHLPELYSLIFASISHFDKALFNISLYYCLTVDSVCERIVSVIQHAQNNVGAGWSGTELWGRRTWLCEDESNHERLLTAFPCINSYCAQIMLTTYTLKELCQLTLQGALQTLVVLPPPFITLFHHLLNQPNTITKPQRKVNFNFSHSQSLRFSPLEVTQHTIPKIKPHHIVKPMFVRDQAKGKRQVSEDNKHSFSFSKKRKVLITKDRISLDGQTQLFIQGDLV